MLVIIHLILSIGHLVLDLHRRHCLVLLSCCVILPGRFVFLLVGSHASNFSDLLIEVLWWPYWSKSEERSWIKLSWISNFEVFQWHFNSVFHILLNVVDRVRPLLIRSQWSQLRKSSIFVFTWQVSWSCLRLIQGWSFTLL